MSEPIDVSTLKSRPAWSVPRYFSLAGRVLLIGSVAMMLIGYAWAYQINEMTSEVEGMDSLMLATSGNMGDTLIGLGFYALNIAFYAGILWLISVIIEKVDQLVWLNASEEDRLYIYHQRIKKKK